MGLGDERFVAFTTFKKDGSAKPVPVWPVDAGDGRVGFITSSASWKVKRLRTNNRVELQPSDARGQVKEATSPSSGTAVVVDGAAFDAVHAKVREKYGFQLTVIKAIYSVQRLFRRGGHANDRAVIVTLDEG